MAAIGRMCRVHEGNALGGSPMTLYIDTRPTLEWVEYNGRHMADGYEIKQTPNGRWILMWTIDNHHYHDTLEAAKAAAQADYEARTAERFRAVEVPTIRIKNPISEYFDGYNDAINDIHEAIAKATSPESLHTKL
jgi:hypothetical protein